MARQYSYIYSKLVKSDDDIIGMIAYAIYKMDKIDYIEKFKQDNNGTEPQEDDLKNFHYILAGESHIESYRMQASSLLNDVIGVSTEKKIDEVKQRLLESSNKRLEDIVGKLIPTDGEKYFSGILQSVLASFVFASLTVLAHYMVRVSQSEVTLTTTMYILTGAFLFLSVVSIVAWWYFYKRISKKK